MPIALLVLAALQAAPAPASPQAEQPRHGMAAPGGPMGEAMTNYRSCLGAKVAATPATATPEAGAALAITGCKAEHDALMGQLNAMLSQMPAEQQAMIRDRIAEREAAVPAQLAERIRAARATGPATSPAPAAPGK